MSKPVKIGHGLKSVFEQFENVEVNSIVEMQYDPKRLQELLDGARPHILSLGRDFVEHKAYGFFILMLTEAEALTLTDVKEVLYIRENKPYKPALARKTS